MPTAHPRQHPVHTDLVRTMLLARGLERRAQQAQLGPRSRPGPTRGRGSEAIAVGAASALGPEDRLFASDRYLAAHLARGLSPEDYLLRCLGGESPRTAAGGIGFASPGGELVDLAAGAALALQLRNSDGVAMALVPSEDYRAGRCDQALRTATYRRLPFVLVVEGVVDAPADPEPHVVEALELETIAATTRAAVETARSGDAPAMVICDDRLPADADVHGDPDEAADPIRRELRRLACNVATRQLIKPLRNDVSATVREADRRARLMRTGFRRQPNEVAVA